MDEIVIIRFHPHMRFLVHKENGRIKRFWRFF